MAMNSYLQKIYKARCEAAEEAADRIRELTGTVTHKFKRMSREGILYTTAERAADSAALEKAQQELEQILKSIYDIEDAERS